MIKNFCTRKLQKCKNYNKVRNNLCQFKKIFQYVYAMVYPEIYHLTERRGFDLKIISQLIFRT